MKNILTERQKHGRYCTQPYANVPRGYPGDVRRCQHGYIMLAYEVPGLIPPMWRTLNWSFPILYLRARKALRDA